MLDRSSLRPLAKVPPRRECDQQGVEWTHAHGVRQDVLDYAARLARVDGRPEEELSTEELGELRTCRSALAYVRRSVEERHKKRTG